MIRNYSGIVLLARSILLVSVSMLLPELMAACEGLYLAFLEMGATRFWLEGNSMCVVSCITKFSLVDGWLHSSVTCYAYVRDSSDC